MIKAVAVASVSGLIVAPLVRGCAAYLAVALERESLRASLETLALPDEDSLRGRAGADSCPQCGGRLPIWRWLPIVGCGRLGRCRCGARAWGLADPIVIALSAATAAAPASLPALLPVMLMLTWVLLTLAFIDMDHFLLPDVLVLPLLWGGLLFSLSGQTITPDLAILGAATGYILANGLALLFRLIRGRDGLGAGDGKLLAAVGAWCGPFLVPEVLVVGSLLGLVTAGVIWLWRRTAPAMMPFGPFLAFAGWGAIMWREPVTAIVLRILTGG